jgi:DNA/RNA endonuclease YhcR with UshA esterase domain
LRNLSALILIATLLTACAPRQQTPVAPPAAAPQPKAQAQATAPPPEGNVIPWHEAHKHMGEMITVEGRIVNTYNTGSVCFLNFVPNDRKEFYLIIFRQNLDAWDEPPQRYFRDKTVRCTGRVEEYQGRPQMKIHDPSQIRIVN